MDLSPDGLVLLFDHMATISNQESEQKNGKKTSRLWMLPLDLEILENDSDWQPQPEELPMTGFNPSWAP